MKLGAAVLLVSIVLAGCGPSDVSQRSPGTLSKEALYAQGHELYLKGKPEDAILPLKEALSRDSAFVDALTDMAAIMYDASKKSDGVDRVPDAATQARSYYARMEALGSKDADVYERLCELTSTAKDARGFVRYAKKYADAFPYDRQYYNLGLAYFAAGEYQNVIDAQKKAAEKFPRSPYIGAYYRQMGHSYIKIDRDQTAERILEKGLGIVNGRLAEMKSGSADAIRLTEDKNGILVSLKRIYTIYKETDKLRQVEKQLQEAGQ